MPPTQLSSLLATVEQRRSQALFRMEAETGGTGVCTISRSGLPVPSLKYDEGAASALADLRRLLLDADPQADESTLLSLIVKVRDQWRQGPAHRLAQTSPDWQAYSTGGEDALSSLLDATSW